MGKLVGTLSNEQAIYTLVVRYFRKGAPCLGHHVFWSQRWVNNAVTRTRQDVAVDCAVRVPIIDASQSHADAFGRYCIDLLALVSVLTLRNFKEQCGRGASCYIIKFQQ